MSKSTIYWIFQGLGWSLYAAFGLIMIAVFSGSINPYFVLNQFMIVAIQLLLSHVLRIWIKRYHIFEKKVIEWVLMLFAAILVVSALTQLIITPLILLITPDELTAGYQLTHSIGYLVQAIFVYIIWAAIYATVYFVRNYRQAEIDKWKLEAEVQKAELTALKAQINPHFIFNALNSIRSLISEDTDNARTALTKLSNLLRYAIQFQARELVTLREEVDIVKGYLTLEKIQLEERLQVEWDVDSQTLDAQVPAMSIQMLAENALKHGISLLAKGGKIRISARKLSSEYLEVKVLNSGRINSNGSSGTGIGLNNIENRLKALLSDQAHVRLIQKENNEVQAVLTIPMT